MANRYIVDVTGGYVPDDSGTGTQPEIIYHTNDKNENEIGQLDFYKKLGIDDTNDNSNVVIFVHGFNFEKDYAKNVFKKMVDKMCADNHINDTKFICVRWNSSANDTDETNIGRLSRFFGGLLPGAVGDEIRRTGNSGPIYNRYVEDLDRVAGSFRGISWLVNELAKSNKKIHLIGHSMGCEAVVNCLSFMCHDNSTLKSDYYGEPQNANISNTIVSNVLSVFLIAPDVNVNIFKLLVINAMPLGSLNRDNFVIYSNNEDLAIYSSELIRVHDHRLGRSIDAVNSLNDILRQLGRLQYIRSNVDKIDVLNLKISALSDIIFAVPRALESHDFPFSHNYYTNESVCRDIGRVIFGGVRSNVRHHQINNNVYQAGTINNSV